MASEAHRFASLALAALGCASSGAPSAGNDMPARDASRDAPPPDAGPADRGPVPDVPPPPDAGPDVTPSVPNMAPWKCDADPDGPPMSVMPDCTADEPWLCDFGEGSGPPYGTCLEGPASPPLCNTVRACMTTGSCGAVIPDDAGVRYYCCDDVALATEYGLVRAYRCLCECAPESPIWCMYSLDCPPERPVCVLWEGPIGSCTEAEGG